MVDVALIQLAADGLPADRVARVGALLDECAGAGLVVLPEQWHAGFFNFEKYHDLAQPIDGSLVSTMAGHARRLGCYLHMGSFLERSELGVHNTSVLLSPDGRVAARYRKAHLFGYESRESQLLTPGSAAVVARTPTGAVGLATCYDLRFPELFRTMSAGGAELFAVCSAWPTARLDAWRLFNRARAHENLACLVACNGCGHDHGTQLAGHSMIVGPDGRILAEADEQETVLRASLDLSQVATLRENFPALADRRGPLELRVEGSSE